MPTSNNYFLENENPKDILITEEQYIEKYNAGEIPLRSVSPYILEKLRREKIEKDREEMSRKKREEHQAKINEAKTRAELNLFTTWISSNENFDLSKFKIQSNKFIDKLNGFKKKVDKLSNGVTELNEINISDDGNFD